MLLHRLSSAFPVFAETLLPTFEKSLYNPDDLISEEVLFQSYPKKWRINNEVRELPTPLHLLTLGTLQPKHRMTFLNKKVHVLSIPSYLDANRSHIITDSNLLQTNINAASSLMFDSCIENGLITEAWLKAHPNFIIASNEDFIFGSVCSANGHHVGCNLIRNSWRKALARRTESQLLVREASV